MTFTPGALFALFFLAGGLGFVIGIFERRRQPLVAEEVRLVDVPVRMGVCSKCEAELHPETGLVQLYLEVWDCHGNQRAKWPVGAGENAESVPALNEPMWRALAEQVRQVVMAANVNDTAFYGERDKYGRRLEAPRDGGDRSA